MPDTIHMPSSEDFAEMLAMLERSLSRAKDEGRTQAVSTLTKIMSAILLLEKITYFETGD